ncbi:MAG: hypothetical protein VX976_02765 [Pseudomonadota bacterium]|nr:hypothetical protein [Pseudomonadota bacterium]
MIDKDSNSPKKGEFIDLEKDQYKKKTNYFRNIILILVLVVLSALSGFYFFYSGLIENFIKKDSTENQEIFLKKEKGKNENKFEDLKKDFEKNQLNEISEKIKVLDENIFENNLKFSELTSAVAEINRRIKMLENNKSSYSGSYSSDKYFILTDLLTLKNNFINRRNSQKELNRLISRFNNNSEINVILIFFQDNAIETIKTKKYLLEELNNKISFYEEDLDKFIEKLQNQNIVEKSKIFESKENFVKYIQNLISSTYKITRIEESNNQTNLVKDNHLFTSLKTTKEYLLLGNLDKAIYTLENSNFDDAEIDKWIKNATSLKFAEENLQVLETRLLRLIGKDFD